MTAGLRQLRLKGGSGLSSWALSSTSSDAGETPPSGSHWAAPLDGSLLVAGVNLGASPGVASIASRNGATAWTNRYNDIGPGSSTGVRCTAWSKTAQATLDDLITGRTDAIDNGGLWVAEITGITNPQLSFQMFEVEVADNEVVVSGIAVPHIDSVVLLSWCVTGSPPGGSFTVTNGFVTYTGNRHLGVARKLPAAVGDQSTTLAWPTNATLNGVAIVVSEAAAAVASGAPVAEGVPL